MKNGLITIIKYLWNYRRVARERDEALRLLGGMRRVITRLHPAVQYYPDRDVQLFRAVELALKRR